MQVLKVLGLLIMISTGLCNKETNLIIIDKMEFTIEKYADKYKIEPALIKAFIKQESNFKQYSIRHEKHLKTNESYSNNIPKKYKNDKYAYSSVGCTQILYGTARWQGFRGTPEELFIFENCIKYSCKYIRYLIKRFWMIEKVIASYNMGSPRTYYNKTLKTNIFKNQFNYVNPVLKFYKQFGGKLDVRKLIIHEKDN